MENKVVIITGASSGIGAEIALHLAKIGYCKLVLVARRVDRLNAIADQCKQFGKGKEILVLVKDFKNPNVGEEIVKECIDKFGELHSVVVNAGMSLPPKSVRNCNLSDVEEIMTVNYYSPFMLTKYALPHLEKTKGTILYISSILAHRVFPHCAPYNSSKAALSHFARTVAIEEGPKGIRCNILSPGFTATEMMEKHSDGKPLDDQRQVLRNFQPLGRVGESGDMAKVAAFLISDDNSFMTGEEVNVDGGLQLTSSLSQ